MYCLFQVHTFFLQSQLLVSSPLAYRLRSFEKYKGGVDGYRKTAMSSLASTIRMSEESESCLGFSGTKRT